jgi:hypothetical protein
LTGVKLDVKRDLRVGFGEFCHVFSKSDNSSAPRTTAGIALMPAGGYTGAHKFLNLSTGRVITRAQFTPVPIPVEYIVVLNEWAKKDALAVAAGHDAESLARMLGEDEIATDGWLEQFHRNLATGGTSSSHPRIGRRGSGTRGDSRARSGGGITSDRGDLSGSMRSV